MISAGGSVTSSGAAGKSIANSDRSVSRGRFCSRFRRALFFASFSRSLIAFSSSMPMWSHRGSGLAMKSPFVRAAVSAVWTPPRLRSTAGRRRLAVRAESARGARGVALPLVEHSGLDERRRGLVRLADDRQHVREVDERIGLDVEEVRRARKLDGA